MPKLNRILNKILNWISESASNLILTSAIFFILGIAVASVFIKNHFDNFYFFVAVCFLAVVLIWFWQAPSQKTRANSSLQKWARFFFFCLLFLTLGVWRFDFSLPDFGVNQIKDYNGQLVEFIGAVSDEPDKRNGHYKLTIKAQEFEIEPLTRSARSGSNYSLSEATPVQQGERSRRVGGKVLLRAPLYPEYKYGDKLAVACEIQAPQKFDNFDYAAYLSRYGIYSVCNFPQEIKFLKSGEKSWFYGPIFSLKNKLADIGGKIFPEPHASFLAALIYGARQGIPDDLTEQFNRVSLTHIIAISGHNISLVVGILLPIFTLMFLPRKWAFPFVILGVVFFVIFTGASASVVRAGIMGIIAALANNTSRQSQSGRILIFVAFLMLAFNPKLLFFDRGFSLSFAATAGLIYLVPIIKNYFKWWKRGMYFRRIVEETSSATIATLPLVIYYFDRISTVSIFANIFVLPIIPMIMLFGFAALLGGLLWQFLGFILAVVPWLLINYIFKVTEFFASFKLSSIDLGRVPWIVPAILYGVLIGWMIWAKRPKKEVVKLDKEAEEYEIIADNH